jgi:osmoprotectant transport system permease protein
MREQILAAWRVLPDYLLPHIVLSMVALLLGIGIGLPLAIVAARHARWRGPLLAVASLIQTIPGLALLAIFYPILLALSGLTQPAFGITLPALGFLPSVLALALYAILPVLRNGVAGLTGIDPAIIEAAKGVGMTPRQSLLKVEAPLAAPVVMAGIRTSAVWTIGAATLATPVGQTSLGNYIFTGLQIENWIFVAFGCVASAVLALLVDRLLALVEQGAALRDARRTIAGLALLVLGVVGALAAGARHDRNGYVLGAKNFSEQFILAALMASRLDAAGATSQTREGLGSAIIYRALANSDIDAYVDYSGTLWANTLGRTDNPPRETMLVELASQLKARDGVVLLGALGFENAYGLAMRRPRATTLGIADDAALARQAPALRFGADLEFLQRPEWAALRRAYGLTFAETRAFDPTFMYRALSDGLVDVISAFTSDGRIAADDLVILADPRHALPSYDAVILVAPKRAGDARLLDALRPLVGAISVDAMRRANLTVDRTADKLTPGQAARQLCRAAQLGNC